MSEKRTEPLELTRVDGGADLWVAIEAAQYAKLVEHDSPLSHLEAARMQNLLGLFEDCSEDWESKTTHDQTMALEQLGCRLSALREVRLHVYSAVTKMGFETPAEQLVQMPLAVLNIRRALKPSITVLLPSALDLA